MLLLTVAIVFAVPVVGCLTLLALFINFGMNKPTAMLAVEIEEEYELGLDEIVKEVLRNEHRRPLYHTGTVAGYRP